MFLCFSCDPVDGTCKCESGNVECNKEADEAGKWNVKFKCI